MHMQFHMKDELNIFLLCVLFIENWELSSERGKKLA